MVHPKTDEDIRKYNREYQRKWRDNNRDIYNKYSRDYYRNNEVKRKNHHILAKRWRENNRDKSRLINIKWYAKNNPRIKIIRILGAKCSNPNCLVPDGCNDIRCLQLDHINGGGSRDFKIHKYHDKLYKFYFDNIDLAKETLQVLCANCNWTKIRENKELYKQVLVH